MKSKEQRAKSNEQQAKTNEQRANGAKTSVSFLRELMFKCAITNLFWLYFLK